MNKITLFFFSNLLPLFLLAQANVSHKEYNDLLSKYVDEKGLVNYVGLTNNVSQLDSYLEHLQKNPPSESWSREEKLAYWINAYNAFTLKLILDNYPVESIKDIGSSIQIPFVNSPWDIKFIEIGEETLDLNNIEHGIIRKEFEEPRIHFALVCAAISCPKLQNEAYFPGRLSQQLDAAARTFLRDESKNEFVNASEARLSKIFNWYGGDFKNDGSLVSYLNRYAPIKLQENARIEWKDYDWALNQQK